MISTLRRLVCAALLLATPASMQKVGGPLAYDSRRTVSGAFPIGSANAISRQEAEPFNIAQITTTPAISRPEAGPLVIAPATTTRLHVEVSAESMEIVSGIIESFMHKIQLRAGEKRCLENNVAELTGDVMGAGLDVVKAIKAVIPHPGANGTAQPSHPFNVVGAGLDGAVKLTSLVTLCTQLVKDCVKGDALDLLKKTAHHLMNTSFVVNRFVVNGVDIARSLSDGIIAYEAHNFKKFGNDIGTALRKILLSKAQHGTKLPEGVPEETIIQETTDGLMRGFFATGSGVEITDAADPRVDISLNLHQCIAGNSVFFKDIFMGFWSLIAQMSANKEQHGLDGHKPRQDQSSWSNDLMMAMAQFPMALDRCNVGSRTEEMLSEAIYSLKEVEVNIMFPSTKLTADYATNEMAKAVEDWTKWKFEDFGKELGKVLRDLVLQAFPQKYSVDSFGRLQRDATIVPGSKQNLNVNPAIIAGAAVAGFVALSAVRAYRSSPMRSIYQEPSSDSEIVEIA